MKTIFTHKLLLGLGMLLCVSNSGVMAQSAAPPYFINEILPPDTVSGAVINLNVESSTHNFNPNDNSASDSTNASVPSFCYNKVGSTAMSYLGPTQFWVNGNNLTIHANNNLPTGYPTTTHWHGANLHAAMDGGPHEPFSPGSSYDPVFQVTDDPALLWYHSHLMDHTTTQVAMGLAGVIYVNDPADLLNGQLPNTYGVNDFPLVIQEKGFVFNSTPLATAIDTGNGMPAHPTNQNYTIINGLMYGYMKVPQQRVRLRFLNGSIRKSFQFGINTKRTLAEGGSYLPMTLIATDGGYTDQPYDLDSVIMMPAERFEFVVDLSGVANGDTVYLTNLASTMPGDIIHISGNGSASGHVGTLGDAFMAFVVDNTIAAPVVAAPPSVLMPYTVDSSSLDTTRFKRLFGAAGSGGAWLIDNTPMDMELLNDTIIVNDQEIWNVVNHTNVAHPFHIHKIEFRVVSITDTVTNTPVPIPPTMKGPRDVVMVRPNWKLSFLANFELYPDSFDVMNGFMYHCHILTHEDSSMMHQFVVITQYAYDSLQGLTSRADEIEMGPFSLYPNPAGDVINLEGTSTGGVLRFIDVQGRVLRKQVLGSFDGIVALNVADLPKGFVIVEWTTGENRFSKKVLLR